MSQTINNLAFHKCIHSHWQEIPGVCFQCNQVQCPNCGYSGEPEVRVKVNLEFPESKFPEPDRKKLRRRCECGGFAVYGEVCCT